MQILLSCFSLKGLGSAGVICVQFGAGNLACVSCLCEFPTVRSASCSFLLFECESWVSTIFNMCEFESILFYVFSLMILFIIVIHRNEEVKG